MKTKGPYVATAVAISLASYMLGLLLKQSSADACFYGALIVGIMSAFFSAFAAAFGEVNG